MGFVGTSITDEDAEVILTSLVRAYSVIPSEARQFIPPLEIMLEAIPQEARKYPLEDVIKLLAWAGKNQIVI